ncbi:hypothetical protein GCM10007276_34680 [Agaricicola taiwanensis]|uniref:Uncharacterized protein n=1 Tax=Agaricicola taiwanensis TaxID=591372 RepID=A0A8J2YN79_9RHOB|nr:hypothetical protein GCM10007276_34680 [Agaricicola taiwanensis]
MVEMAKAGDIAGLRRSRSIPCRHPPGPSPDIVILLSWRWKRRQRHNPRPDDGGLIDAADKVARTIHGMMTGAEGKVVQLPNRKRKT